MLIVVARDQPDLYQYLKGSFAGVTYVRVTLDRRDTERRRGAGAREGPERRASDRRSQPNIDRRLRSQGYAIVCEQERWSGRT